jgi:thiol-disulfide isomerase/thioredoxin
MSRKVSIVRLISVLLLSTLNAEAATAPNVKIRSVAQLPKPLPKPYDADANADAQINAAFARAKASGKRPLVDFGGNWCPDCLILAGVMNLPDVKPFVDEHFEVVSVDVGRFNKNLAIAKALHIPKLYAVPWVVIAKPDGSIIASTYEIADEHHSSVQSKVDWLARFADDPTH